MEQQANNYALMIDADNVSAKYVKVIFDELSSYGTVSIRRIYGNWSKNYDWNESVLLEYSIQPIHQFDYTKGKNSTDITMVIDAMDILYSGNVDGFCIVTSDSDYTKLAMRLREDRMYVIGMGESKTPAALVKACDRFIHLNLIAGEEPKPDKSGEEQVKAKKETAVTTVREVEEAIIDFLNSGENGAQVNLGEVGTFLKQKFTDFDVRNYGYSQLNVFVREKCGRLCLHNDKGTTYAVTVKNEVDIDTVKREVIEIIKSSGGVIKNLSIVYNELKKRHKHFILKNYGFSRTSSFLRSFPELEVSNNTVKLKKNASKSKKA